MNSKNCHFGDSLFPKLKILSRSLLRNAGAWRIFRNAAEVDEHLDNTLQFLQMLVR